MLLNRSYETGWEEGWSAALGKVQEDGLDAVLAMDASHVVPVQLAITLELDPDHAVSGDERRLDHP
jgi:hypothetical protein